jgi:hypothetical protein
MIKLSTIKPNPDNPRLIKDEKFYKLVSSLETFGEKMMPLRPIVIDENNIILGGNMRFKALKELGYSKVPESWIKRAEELTEAEKREFIIKDNIGFGNWDWSLLSNQWDSKEVSQWGLDLEKIEDIDLTEFFENDFTDNSIEQSKKIILEYTEQDYEKVIDAIQKIGGSPEKVFWNLLNL